MVYPAHELIIKVGINGTTSTAADMKVIKDIETIEVTIENDVQEWKSFQEEGWTSALTTGKKLSITLEGKRNVGDPGNDYIAGLALFNGTATQTLVSITFPDNSVLSGEFNVSVTNFGAGGAATDVAGLSAELISNGKPEYTSGS